VATIDILRNDPGAQTIAAGTVVFREGDAGDHAYVITEGEIELSHARSYLDVLGPGDIFGEMTLIDHKVRIATATATTACTIVPIDRRRFLYLVQNTPYFAIEVMAMMADRLRRMDERI
jgi:CRP/FNR family cyclic AMP-dependent transcriptional regulator